MSDCQNSGTPREGRYRPVSEISGSEQVGMVREIFSTVTGEYDFLNHLLSLRRDIAWRKSAVREMLFFRTGRLLDIATGTADLAIEAALAYPDIEVVGIDFSKPMLCEGKRKILPNPDTAGRIMLVQGDALRLPFPDMSFDTVSIAFGIRNIPDKPGVLREMRRVAAPGGRVLVLEMTLPEGKWFRRIYSIYLRRILPSLARPFTHNPAAYAYLADTISNFPSPGSLSKMIEGAGLTDVKYYPLSCGITYLHAAKAPDHPLAF